MFFLYLVLTALLTLVMVVNLFRTQNLVVRITYALMVIPFLLRTFAIK